MPATRSAAGPVEMIRGWIHEGKYADGTFLPPVREIGALCGVSPETVRRGLKYLESEGLVSAEPRQGFRVCKQAREQPRYVFAYVSDNVPDLSTAQPVNWALTRAITQQATQNGGMALGMHVGKDVQPSVSEQLRASHVSGAIVDTLNRPFLDELTEADLPLVMVNSWFEGAPVDVVLQDNYLGGMLAAQHLASTKHVTRIAWAGPVEQFCHSRERYAGAIAGLLASGRTGGVDVILKGTGDAAYTSIRKALEAKDRPDGIFAFGPHVSRAIKRACDELNLVVGRDVTVVGWTVEECYDTEHKATYAGGDIPACIVWNAQAMACAATQRLEARTRQETEGFVRILIPTRLKRT